MPRRFVFQLVLVGLLACILVLFLLCTTRDIPPSISNARNTLLLETNRQGRMHSTL
uniref:Uncharacterized protein n=1 Tax=Rhizophora mucronata TaxID=61149 RepID=A0A2P2PMW4_RHIMU